MNVGTINNFDSELINKKLKEGKKLRIDIGTSISAPVTRYWFKNLSDIYVIGIEPNPNCYDKSNLWQNRSWNIVNEFKNHPQTENYYHLIGACDNVEFVTTKPFYLLSGNVGCSSLLEPKYEAINGCNLEEIINVETFSMNFLLDKIKYNLIELVKIDTQGKDLDIVKSFGQHLKNVCYLDIEDDATRYYKGAASHNEILEYLLTFGFKHYATDNENLRFFNTIIKIPIIYNNITGDM